MIFASSLCEENRDSPRFDRKAKKPPVAAESQTYFLVQFEGLKTVQLR